MIIICIKDARVNTDAKISLINIKNQFMLRDKKKRNSSGTLKKSKNCRKKDNTIMKHARKYFL